MECSRATELAPAAPLALHRATVLPEWVDYNGHMTESSYVLVFGHATDAFLDHIGMDDAMRRATATSVYTVESHINYLAEARQGEDLAIDTQLLAHDAKRLHLHHAMRRAADGRLLATTELMLLHVDKAGPRAAPFRPATAAAIAAIARAQAGLAKPANVGRAIGLS
jgi:acyl-CoA thioester hydrolase